MTIETRTVSPITSPTNHYLLSYFLDTDYPPTCKSSILEKFHQYRRNIDKADGTDRKIPIGPPPPIQPQNRIAGGKITMTTVKHAIFGL